MSKLRHGQVLKDRYQVLSLLGQGSFARVYLTNDQKWRGNLVASLNRFNRRWAEFLGRLDLEPLNRSVDHYNRYYLLEKECCLGSARLAARHFIPQARVTRESLLEAHPILPVPGLVA